MKNWYFLLVFIVLGSFGLFADDASFLKDCMDTVRDRGKCEEFLRKTKERLHEEHKTENHGSGLKIRSEIKSTLQGKNKLYVIQYLGEPDERQKNGPDYEHFVYTRPISQKTESSKPDLEIRVIFRRELVSRVRHQPPEDEEKPVNILGDPRRQK